MNATAMNATAMNTTANTPPATEHSFYARDSALSLPPLSWPGGQPLALALVVSAEYYDLYPSEGAFTPPNVPGGFGRGPYPDFRAFSIREYGNRVGAFRLMDVIEQAGLKATLAADAHVARTRPDVVRAALALGWEIAGHGVSVTEIIGEHLSEAQEREYIERSLAPLRELTGAEILGWHGPEYGESSRTPALLAEQGVRYLLDWPHDERPVPMNIGGANLLSLPMSADLDDVMAHWHRKISMQRWRQSVLDAVQRLCADGHAGGRLLILNLHPWLMGQPYRVSHLEDLLRDLRARDGIWFTTTAAIAAHAGLAYKM
jgi:peptidoglycan/xylan/chitin deacetylase (PgdA/CDA1 family)